MGNELAWTYLEPCQIVAMVLSELFQDFLFQRYQGRKKS